MQKLFKKTAWILCIVLITSVLCFNVYAENESLEINYKLDGATFELYRVATRHPDGALSLTKAFEDYQVDLNMGKFRDIAVTLSGYIARDNVPSDMSAATDQGKCTFQSLESGIYLILGENVTANGYIHTPIPVLVELNGFGMSIDMKSEQTPEIEQDPVSCTVEKIWCGDGDHPKEVTVQLLKNGHVYDEVILNLENDWNYTWSDLNSGHKWQVIEKEVADGYYVSVIQNGLSFRIINTVSEPLPPQTDDTMLTAHKVWDDNNSSDRPESVSIHLLRNGQLYDVVELNASNQWTYTWNRLDAYSDWSVIEAEVPEGYTVTYDTFGNIVYITNTKASTLPPPSDPVDLTVRKEWVGDDDTLEDRPESVGVTLYNASTAIGTVWLGEWNNWTYKWEDLEANGDWSVFETCIPDGYTPSYSVNGNTVTITNTSTLIQTGQLNWPIPVLGSLGVIIIFFGIVIMLKKKENGNA